MSISIFRDLFKRKDRDAGPDVPGFKAADAIKEALKDGAGKRRWCRHWIDAKTNWIVSEFNGQKTRGSTSIGDVARWWIDAASIMGAGIDANGNIVRTPRVSGQEALLAIAEVLQRPAYGWRLDSMTATSATLSKEA